MWRRRQPAPTRLSESLPDGALVPPAGVRRRAWLAFQRALDPLAPPKPLPQTKRR
jgi:hypothetical protein